MNRQRREKYILDAALKVFVRRGYEAVNVSDLVEAASVSRGTFYLYFNSKKEVFDCLIDKFLGEILHLLSVWQRHLHTMPQVSFRGDFDKLMHDIILSLSHYRLLGRMFIVDLSLLESAHRKKVMAYHKQICSVLQDCLHEGLSDNISASDIQMLSTCLVGAVKEFLTHLSDKSGSTLEIRMRLLMDFVLRHFMSQENSVDSKPTLSLVENGSFSYENLPNSSSSFAHPG